MTAEKKIYLKKIINVSFWIFIALALGLTIWYVVIYLKQQNNENLSIVDQQFIRVWSVMQSFFIIIGLPLNFLKIYTTIKSLAIHRNFEKEEEKKMNLFKKQKIKKYLEIKKQKEHIENNKKELSKKDLKLQNIQKILKDKNVYLNKEECLELLKIVNLTMNPDSIIHFIFEKCRLKINHREANLIIENIKKEGN